MGNKLMTARDADRILSKMDNKLEISPFDTLEFKRVVKYKKDKQLVKLPFLHYIFLEGTDENFRLLFRIVRNNMIFKYHVNLQMIFDGLEDNDRLSDTTFQDLYYTCMKNNLLTSTNLPYFSKILDRLDILQQMHFLSLVKGTHIKLPLVSLLKQNEEKLNIKILEYILSVYDTLDIPIKAISFENESECSKIIHLYNKYGCYRDLVILYGYYSKNQIELKNKDISNKPDYIELF